MLSQRAILRTQMKWRWIQDLASVGLSTLQQRTEAPWNEKASAELRALCGNSSFHRSFVVLPEPLRSQLWLLYAWMRLVDDLVDDEGQDKDSRLQALKDFRLKTRLALAGRLAGEDHPVMSKLHIFSSIRPELFDAMMDGQESDLRFEQPQDFDALLKYCDQVASSVGELVLELLGEPRAELAQALGRSLQLLNICRDLREDFDRGRVYLPRSWVAAPQPEWAENRREFLGALFKVQDELNTQLTRARQLEHELEKPISRTFVGLIRKAYDPWWQRLLSNPSQFLDPMPRLTWLERLRGLF